MNKSNADNLVFKLFDPLSQFDSVKEIWTFLLNKCPHSYHLSWAWTEIWLKSLPPDCELFLIAGYINKSPVLAFFLGSKITTRHRFFKYRQLALNQTLIPHVDSATYIEYNSILIDPKITISLEPLLEIIPIKSWDEFLMMRCSQIYQPNLIVNNKLNKKFNLNTEKCESYYMDLDKIRRNKNDYLALLSPNRRQQIRRSIKEYEKLGEIQIRIADRLEDALAIFDELIELHQKRWTERGYAGALSNEYAVNFHKSLISNRLKHGEIQLMKVSAGNTTIGCLYNIIYDRNILFITCGFNYLEGHLYRPGIVCHYYAIVHNAMLGLNCYDFLEGEHNYKRSLSSNQIIMENILIRKNSVKQNIEDITVTCYRLLKKALNKIKTCTERLTNILFNSTYKYIYTNML